MPTGVSSTATSAAGGKAFVRPMFQGKLIADVVPVGPGPHLVTCQIGAFRADAMLPAASPFDRSSWSR